MTGHDFTRLWYPSFDGLHVSLWQGQQIGWVILALGLIALASSLAWGQFHPKH